MVNQLKKYMDFFYDAPPEKLSRATMWTLIWLSPGYLMSHLYQEGYFNSFPDILSSLLNGVGFIFSYQILNFALGTILQIFLPAFDNDFLWFIVVLLLIRLLVLGIWRYIDSRIRAGASRSGARALRVLLFLEVFPVVAAFLLLVYMYIIVFLAGADSF